jgi:predicted nucleotidyltransferase
LRVFLYGSVSVFLCGEFSDLDVCVINDTEKSPQVLALSVYNFRSYVKVKVKVKVKVEVKVKVKVEAKVK